MKKPTKTKAVKAVKFWKSADGSYLYPDKKAAQYFSGFQAPSVKPVAVLPADAESVEAMVEQMAASMCVPRYRLHAENVKAFYRNKARAALAAIGIKGYCK